MSVTVFLRLVWSTLRSQSFRPNRYMQSLGNRQKTDSGPDQSNSANTRPFRSSRAGMMPRGPETA
eukprot:2077437-Rhodomonas_salina.3